MKASRERDLASSGLLPLLPQVGAGQACCGGVVVEAALVVVVMMVVVAAWWWGGMGCSRGRDDGERPACDRGCRALPPGMLQGQPKAA